jgi:heme exporter protein A
MAEFAIETNKLTKQFGERKAVDALSIQVPQGAFLSIFGQNGAGKTTLLRMLSTIARPSSGSARVCGIDLREDAFEIRGRIGLISHQPFLYPDLSALQNLELYAKLYGVENAEKRVMELLEAVELKHRRFDSVKTFSRGMTQRLAIARALINNPELVFLDEPYSGLDPHAIEIFDSLLAQVREGRTFVMVSHDLNKGYEMCTHVLVMAKGKEVAFAEKSELPREEFRSLYLKTVGAGVQ